LTGFFKIYFSF